MNAALLSDLLLDALMSGDRTVARRVMLDAEVAGWTGEQVITELLWPLHDTVEKMHRSDKISRLSYRLATRLLRVLADQAAARLTFQPSVARSALVISGPSDADELAGQMAVDLLEAGGFAVAYAGGDIPSDEIMAHVHDRRPDVLVIFGAAPSDLPEIRRTIDNVREIAACPNLQVVVGGGVFARASGLAEEIGADLWADSPFELVQAMIEDPQIRATPEQRTVGRVRKSKAA
ncbi:MAG: cobalamin B12-binding domain-containing protein [Phycisphaeraceae bacterium]|nr:cobalamin B12-binding domain-containing protein [Phycisphaeraceae bacterium]